MGACTYLFSPMRLSSRIITEQPLIQHSGFRGTVYTNLKRDSLKSNGAASNLKYIFLHWTEISCSGVTANLLQCASSSKVRSVFFVSQWDYCTHSPFWCVIGSCELWLRFFLTGEHGRDP